ncbi:MAG: hypothetical protein IJT14_03650, partial [Rickettsiales bacterium]|nr:hypothetical protein [Rickettsiales bacterium]
KVKDFLRDKELKLLSLSLSLAARRDNINIINKFHINKIAIKQREYRYWKINVKMGCCVVRGCVLVVCISLCATQRI